MAMIRAGGNSERLSFTAVNLPEIVKAYENRQPGRYDLEDLADRMEPYVTTRDIRNMLARPDRPELDSIQQLEEFFGDHGSERELNLNIILLFGLASYKEMQYRAKGVPPEKQLPFMGDHVQHIAGHCLARLHFTEADRRKIRREGGIKQFANWVFYRVVYRSEEDMHILHPKVAYWWTGAEHWHGPHSRSDGLRSYLYTMRKASLHRLIEHELELYDRDPLRHFDDMESMYTNK